MSSKNGSAVINFYTNKLYLFTGNICSSAYSKVSI